VPSRAAPSRNRAGVTSSIDSKANIAYMQRCHYRCPPDIDLLTTCSEYCPTNPEVWRSHCHHTRGVSVRSRPSCRSGRYRWPKIAAPIDVLCLAHRNRLMRWRPPHCHKGMRRHGEAPIHGRIAGLQNNGPAGALSIDQRGTRMQTLGVAKARGGVAAIMIMKVVTIHTKVSIRATCCSPGRTMILYAHRRCLEVARTGPTGPVR
jgi:hypothetical protein